MPGQRQSRGGDAPYPQDQRDRGGRSQGRGRSSRGGDYYPDTDMGMPDPRPQRDPRRGGYDDRGYNDRGYDRDSRRGGYDDRPPRRGYDDRPPRGYDDRSPRGGYDDRRYDDRNPRSKQQGGGKAFGKFIGILLLLVIFLAGGAFLGLMLGGKGVIPEGLLGKFGLVPQSSVPDPALVASDKKDLVSYWENEEGIKDLSEKLADGTVKDLIDGKKSTTKESGNETSSNGSSSSSSSSTNTDNDTASSTNAQQTTQGTTSTTTGQPAADGVAQAQQVDPATGQPVATPAPAPAPVPAPEQPVQTPPAA